jgi:hypothetical protein
MVLVGNVLPYKGHIGTICVICVTVFENETGTAVYRQSQLSKRNVTSPNLFTC